ncbi:MAG: ribonucleoside-diphosphate reductase, adenosylcobalamin-dependent, partial [bacterium]
EEFIDIKNDLDAVTKANISLKITDEFMEAVRDDKEYELYFYVEDTGEEIKKKVNARRMFNKMAYSNWNVAEPGALFWDRIENYNLLSEIEEFNYAGVNPLT